MAVCMSVHVHVYLLVDITATTCPSLFVTTMQLLYIREHEKASLEINDEFIVRGSYKTGRFTFDASCIKS